MILETSVIWHPSLLSVVVLVGFKPDFEILNTTFILCKIRGLTGIPLGFGFGLVEASNGDYAHMNIEEENGR